jgi:hypothetical protein
MPNSILINEDEKATSRHLLSDENKRRFKGLLDAYKVETRQPTTTGSVISFLVLPLALLFSAILLLRLINTPLNQTNSLVWTHQFSPFPITIKCLAVGGCQISNNDKDQTPQACVLLEEGQEQLFEIHHFDSIKYGISILSKVDGTNAAISYLSETYMPWLSAADSSGTYLMYAEMLPGTSYLNMVKTHNTTLPGTTGEHRIEYFQQQVDFDGTTIIADSYGSCPTVASGWNVLTDGDIVQTRVRLSVSSNFVEVTSPLDLMSWVGNSAGLYAALISWGGVVLKGSEFFRGKKSGEQQKQKQVKDTSCDTDNSSL